MTNIVEMYKKIKRIDESLAPPSGPIYPASGNRTMETQCDECGDDAPEQPASPNDVTMNVTMSGNGQQGIRDLINILQDLEHGGVEDGEHAEIITSEPHYSSDEDDEISIRALEDDEWANSDDNMTVAGVDAVLPTGDDLFANRGDSRIRKFDMPRARVSEDLVRKLSSMYENIKRRGKNG